MGGKQYRHAPTRHKYRAYDLGATSSQAVKRRQAWNDETNKVGERWNHAPDVGADKKSNKKMLAMQAHIVDLKKLKKKKQSRNQSRPEKGAHKQRVKGKKRNREEEMKHLSTLKTTDALAKSIKWKSKIRPGETYMAFLKRQSNEKHELVQKAFKSQFSKPDERRKAKKQAQRQKKQEKKRLQAAGLKSVDAVRDEETGEIDYKASIDHAKKMMFAQYEKRQFGETVSRPPEFTSVPRGAGKFEIRRGGQKRKQPDAADLYNIDEETAALREESMKIYRNMQQKQIEQAQMEAMAAKAAKEKAKAQPSK